MTNVTKKPQRAPQATARTSPPAALPTYQPAVIEAAVQDYWETAQSFAVVEDATREKYYCLSMWPYPSGQLHMGHVRNYTIGDVISRYQRMLGKNVLQPMGWDAFGLPAENAAIAHKVAPAKWTDDNIAYMKGQLQRLGFAYDWGRELTACSPDYYRWEQWFFTRLMERGLAYRKRAVVNWDPVEQTVLANEQVENGRGWRSGALVERKEIAQWFIRITAYAEELLTDLAGLDGWPDAVRTMQENWIGRSEGVEFSFTIAHEAADPATTAEPLVPIVVYTTRPDTIMGITFISVAAEHPLALQQAAHDPAVADFIADCKNMQTNEAAMATMEKKGVPLAVYGVHPLSGEKIPIWAANFVLMGYGTGAVMAVPAHDTRDWEFASQYDLPIRPVIERPDSESHDYATGALVRKDGVVCNSGPFDGLDFAAAFDAVAAWLEARQLGKRTINYRLRDWGVSRQRYWGCPIPVVYDANEVAHAVVDFPVELPHAVEFSGVQSPLATDPNFYQTTMPNSDTPARREVDTFDTFVESSWYFARYCCPDATESMLDARANYWLPVDQYVGGIEHAVLHLLYARFFHKLMRDVGLVDSDEPFTNLLCQGMVLKDGTKMSKSKGNTVDPQAMIDLYGADTVRLFIMFAAPPEQSLEWSEAAVAGAHRFLHRWWRFVQTHKETVDAARATLVRPQWSATIIDATARTWRTQIHTLLDKARRDYAKKHYHTVVAAGMELLNALEKFAPQVTPTVPARAAAMREGMVILNKLLAPIAPHIAHQLWQDLGEAGDVIDATWPEVDPAARQTEQVVLVMQVNGKLRATIEVAPGRPRAELEALALADARMQPYLAGKTVRKVIVVADKIVNIVV